MSIDTIVSRRSIRSFKDEPVPPDALSTLVEAALRAPSSMSKNPWHFVVITEKSLLKQLAAAKPHGASFLEEAPLAIAVCADPAKSDVWIEDASIAAILIQLAAESVGLGSCWVQLRGRMHDARTPAGRFAAGIIGIPEELEVAYIIAAGHPAERKAPHPRENLLWNRLHLNRYGTPFDSGS